MSLLLALLSGGDTTGSLVLTGHAVSLRTGSVASPSTGVLTLTGQAPGIRLAAFLTPVTGVLTLTGHIPIAATGSTGQSATPATGVLTILGYAPTATGSVAFVTEAQIMRLERRETSLILDTRTRTLKLEA